MEDEQALAELVPAEKDIVASAVVLVTSVALVYLLVVELFEESDRPSYTNNN
ncbi:MAG: hypothetical protein WCL18_07250 [bacterium]